MNAAAHLTQGMRMIPEFDARTWFQRHQTEFSFDPSKLQHVLEFTLLWNLFEAKICEKEASLKRIRNAIRKHTAPIQTDCFEAYVEALKCQLPEPLSKDHLGEILLSSTRNTPRIESEVLCDLVKLFDGSKLNRADMMTALFFVAWRVRNNLFHGEKELKSLRPQEGLFKVINSLLSAYLDETLRTKEDHK